MTSALIFIFKPVCIDKIPDEEELKNQKKL